MIGRGGPVRREIPVKAAVGSANDASLRIGLSGLESGNLPGWAFASVRSTGAVGSANDASLRIGLSDLKSVNLPVWTSASIRQGRRSLVKSFDFNSQRTGQRLVEPLSNSISSGASPALLAITSNDTVTFVLAGKT